MSEQTPSVPEDTAGEASGQVRVPREKFINAYVEVVSELKSGKTKGKGNEIVAARLGIAVDSVQQRATKYRREYGIALPKMPRSGGAKFATESAQAELQAALAKFGLAEKPADEQKQETAPPA